MLHELRTAVRSLLKAPGFAAVTVLTLAVAIGANTAIFSVVDAVLLRPLAYPEAERVVTVAAMTRPRPGTEGGELPFSDRGYWHFVENNRTFDQFGGYASATIQWALTSEGPPTQLNVAAMTASAFEVLGVAPQRGRLPTEEEDVAGGPQVILLSNDLWRGVFGGSPDVIGRTVELNAESWEVIGIMPPGYHFPNPDIDAWITRRLDPTSQNFGGHHIQGIARLLPDATVESATADAESLIARFGEVGYGPTWFTGVFSGEATVRTLQEQVIGDAREPLLILLGTVLFVLLIACSNVANLFLVRSEARTRDTAVRVAMGSGRGRLIRFVLTESVLLGLAGGALGVILAWIGLEVLVSVGPPSIPRLDEIGLSGTALGYTAGLSILAGLLFGALPAFRTGTPRMLASLRDGGRSSTLGREEQRARNVLVVAQVALALVLLVGSALMVRSFQEIRSVDPGFDPDGVLTFGLSLAPARYGDSPPEMLEGITRVYDQLFEEIEGLPGVVATGGVNTLPLTGGGARLTTQVEEFPTPEDEFPPVFSIRRATPGYFEAMGIPLVEGRTFDDRDHQERLGTLIMSEGVKERFWPNSTALGKRMQTAGAPATSVGVVGDVHDTSLETEAEQFIYKPVLDSIGGGVASMSVVVRTEGGSPVPGPGHPEHRLLPGSHGAHDRHPVHERHRRRVPQPHQLHHGPAGRGRAGRPLPRRGGNLRGDLLHRRPAHRGDRRTPGPGRRFRKGSKAGHGPGIEDGRPRDRARPPGRPLPRAGPLLTPLRSQRLRPRVPRGRLRPLPLGGRPGERGPGGPGVGHPPGGGAAERVGCRHSTPMAVDWLHP